MSILKQIASSDSESELIQLIEHVIDTESSLSWGEEAAVLERNGEKDKADILRAAEKRWFELENE